MPTPAVADEHSEVTSVIRHKVKPDQQATYEKWLAEIVPVAARFPGHRGVNVIRPTTGACEYTIVLHFDTIDNLRTWLNSDARHGYIEKVLPLLAGEDSVEIKTGLEFWFTPPSKPRIAPPHKQVMVSFSVIYPLTLLVPYLLRPLFTAVPALNDVFARQFIADGIAVVLLTYVIMPRYVRLIAGWLYRG